MAYRNTFFRWLFLYSLTFGLTYVLKLFTYLCPETGQPFPNPVRLLRTRKRKNRKQGGYLPQLARMPMHSRRRRQQNLFWKTNSALPVFCFFSNGF